MAAYWDLNIFDAWLCLASKEAENMQLTIILEQFLPLPCLGR